MELMPSAVLLASAAGLGPLAQFFVQLAATLGLARVLAIVLRRLRQPAVIADIAAGILLGPTLLGALSPAAMEWLFPRSSHALLESFASLGIALFMFTIGLDFPADAIHGRRRAAVAISHASIVAPFALGLAIAHPLSKSFGTGHAFLPFALFIATAMSITAFPVLARILEERGLIQTPLGALALTCAAVDDVTAWILLAIVSSIAKSGTWTGALPMLALVIAWVIAMLTIVPRLLARWRDNELMPFLFLFASAAVADAIGVHAVFGAFLAGVVIPLTAEQRRTTRERLLPAAQLLLPLFFAWSGLRTDFGLLLNGATFVASIVILTVAVAGKLGGGTLAARFTGSPWREAVSIGVLMNTRGLMELLVLNIGYDLGLLSADLFAAFVVMALVTTLSTTPLLRQLLKRRVRDADTLPAPAEAVWDESLERR